MKNKQQSFNKSWKQESDSAINELALNDQLIIIPKLF